MRKIKLEKKIIVLTMLISISMPLISIPLINSNGESVTQNDINNNENDMFNSQEVIETGPIAKSNEKINSNNEFSTIAPEPVVNVNIVAPTVPEYGFRVGEINTFSATVTLQGGAIATGDDALINWIVLKASDDSQAILDVDYTTVSASNQVTFLKSGNYKLKAEAVKKGVDGAIVSNILATPLDVVLALSDLKITSEKIDSGIVGKNYNIETETTWSDNSVTTSPDDVIIAAKINGADATDSQVEINGATIIFKIKGSFEIIATSKQRKLDNTFASASLLANINDAPLKEIKISTTEDVSNCIIGQTIHFSKTFTGADGQPMTGVTTEWRFEKKPIGLNPVATEDDVTFKEFGEYVIVAVYGTKDVDHPQVVSNSITINVLKSVKSIAISTNTSNLIVNKPYDFSATTVWDDDLSSADNSYVIWTVTSSDGGTFKQDGINGSKITFLQAKTYSVTATSTGNKADGSKAVNVVNGIRPTPIANSINITEPSAQHEYKIGLIYGFNAEVIGTDNIVSSIEKVEWIISGSVEKTIESNTYKANISFLNSGIYTIYCQSVNPGINGEKIKSNVLSINVNAYIGTVTIDTNEPDGGFKVGVGDYRFSATVNWAGVGTDNSVTWSLTDSNNKPITPGVEATINGNNIIFNKIGTYNVIATSVGTGINGQHISGWKSFIVTSAVKSININEPIFKDFKIGESYVFTAEVKGNSGELMPTEKITWKISGTHTQNLSNYGHSNTIEFGENGTYIIYAVSTSNSISGEKVISPEIRVNVSSYITEIKISTNDPANGYKVGATDYLFSADITWKGAPINNNVVWSVTNLNNKPIDSSIAIVNNNNIIFKKAGDYKIIVTTGNYSFYNESMTAEKIINVSTAVKSVDIILPTDTNYKRGMTYTFYASVIGSDNESMFNEKVKWVIKGGNYDQKISADTRSISITFNENGGYSIQAISLSDGVNDQKINSEEISVNVSSYVQEVKINTLEPEGGFKTGSRKYNFSASVIWAGGSNGDQTVVWSVPTFNNNPTTSGVEATIDGNNIIFNKTGTYKVVATSIAVGASGEKVSAEATYNVSSAINSIKIIAPSVATYKKGQPYNFSAVITGSDGQIMTNEKVVWNILGGTYSETISTDSLSNQITFNNDVSYRITVTSVNVGVDGGVVTSEEKIIMVSHFVESVSIDTVAPTEGFKVGSTKYTFSATVNWNGVQGDNTVNWTVQDKDGNATTQGVEATVNGNNIIFHQSGAFRVVATSVGTNVDGKQVSTYKTFTISAAVEELEIVSSSDAGFKKGLPYTFKAIVYDSLGAVMVGEKVEWIITGGEVTQKISDDSLTNEITFNSDSNYFIEIKSISNNNQGQKVTSDSKIINVNGYINSVTINTKEPSNGFKVGVREYIFSATVEWNGKQGSTAVIWSVQDKDGNATTNGEEASINANNIIFNKVGTYRVVATTLETGSNGKQVSTYITVEITAAIKSFNISQASAFHKINQEYEFSTNFIGSDNLELLNQDVVWNISGGAFEAVEGKKNTFKFTQNRTYNITATSIGLDIRGEKVESTNSITIDIEAFASNIEILNPVVKITTFVPIPFEAQIIGQEGVSAGIIWSTNATDNNAEVVNPTSLRTTIRFKKAGKYQIKVKSNDTDLNNNEIFASINVDVEDYAINNLICEDSSTTYIKDVSKKYVATYPDLLDIGPIQPDMEWKAYGLNDEELDQSLFTFSNLGSNNISSWANVIVKEQYYALGYKLKLTMSYHGVTASIEILLNIDNNQKKMLSPILGNDTISFGKETTYSVFVNDPNMEIEWKAYDIDDNPLIDGQIMFVDEKSELNKRTVTIIVDQSINALSFYIAANEKYNINNEVWFEAILTEAEPENEGMIGLPLLLGSVIGGTVGIGAMAVAGTVIYFKTKKR